MKRLLAILLIYCTPHLADAQSSVSPDSTFWRFAEISGVIGGFSSKLKVEVNYGENVTGWFKTPEMLTDPITGKPAKFNSMIDALNFMSVQGWDLVQSYFTEEGAGIKTLHFVIKRKEVRQK